MSGAVGRDGELVDAEVGRLHGLRLRLADLHGDDDGRGGGGDQFEAAREFAAEVEHDAGGFVSKRGLREVDGESWPVAGIGVGQARL